jgi:hypothetical protein
VSLFGQQSHVNVPVTSHSAANVDEIDGAKRPGKRGLFNGHAPKEALAHQSNTMASWTPKSIKNIRAATPVY